MNNDLRTELSFKPIKSYGSFENIFLNTLNKHAPIKKKKCYGQIMHYMLLRHLER